MWTLVLQGLDRGACRFASPRHPCSASSRKSVSPLTGGYRLARRVAHGFRVRRPRPDRGTGDVVVSEPLCPFGDGRHKRSPWHDAATARSGLACVRCSKTWQFVGDALVPSYDLLRERA